MIKRSLIAASFAVALMPAAGAQVFVIGGGLAKECYETVERGFYSFRDAEEKCTRALREEKLNIDNRAATYVNRGVIYMREGKHAEALADYADATRLRPQLGAAYLNEGAAHIYLKEFAAAIAPLDKAIELETADIFAAYYNRAIAKENTGDVEGAYYDFQKALELKPGWELAERQLTRFEIVQQ